MPKTFPIFIDDTRFRTARALAKDIAERGEKCILPERASGHPSDDYARWMRDDDSGATTEAVLEACALLIDEDVSGDAWDHAVALTGSDGSEATILRVLERVEAADLPDARWYGTSPEIGHRALIAVTYAIETRMAQHRARLAGLLEAHGDFYRAASLLLRGGNADAAVVDIVGRWAKTRPIPADEARTLARQVRRHASLVVPLAQALAPANEEARERFQATIDEYAPDRSAEVAAALGSAR